MQSFGDGSGENADTTEPARAVTSRRPTSVPAELLLVVAAAFVIRLAVYFLLPNIIYPDEIFQVTEPAHRLAFGTGLTSWEWLVGIRSWLLPGVFAALMWLGGLMGDAPWLVNLPVAVFMAAAACVPVACAWGWGRAVSGRAGGFVAAGFCAVWIDLVYMSNHTLTEVVAANFMVLGLYLGYAGPGIAVARRRLFWSGVMLGTAFVLRFHLSPALAVAAIGICGVTRGWKPWRAFLAGAAVPVALLALLDWATLGLPLQSIWLNFWLNAVVGVSRGAGVSPFATLLLMPVQIWGPIGFLLVAAAIGLGTRRLPLLLAVALTIFVVHSFFAHKEYRFIYPAIPLLAVLAGVGTSRIVQRVLDGRTLRGCGRAALAGGLVLGWSALSLSIGMSDVFNIPWTRGRSYMEVFDAASRDRTICGVGVYGMYWTETGGQTWLPRHVRIYEAPASLLPAQSAAYNAIIARRGVTVPDPSYRKVACFAGDRDASGNALRGDCLWRRPGRCDPRRRTGARPDLGRFRSGQALPARAPEDAMTPDGYSLSRQDLDHIAGGVAPLRGALAGGSILITGGTGFFGMWLVEGLLWANAAHGLDLRLTVLSRNADRFLAGRGLHLRGQPNLTVLSGDVASFDPGGRRFTHIVHAANEGDAGHSASRHLDAALGGTRRVIDLAAAHDTEAVLLTSSGAVYRPMDPPSPGASVEGPAGAGDYTAYRAVYAEAKRMMETMVAAGSERHGFRAAIARCFAFTGAYLPLDGGLAMGNFLRDALAGRDIVIAGDGTAIRSYLYGADLAIWLLTVLLQGQNCRPYNVGGAEAVSIADLARLVSAQAGRPEGVVIRTPARPGAPRDTYLPDLSRTMGELGLQVGVELPQAVRRTLDWYGGRRDRG